MNKEEIKQAKERLKNINYENCKKQCEPNCFDCYIEVEDVKAIDTIRLRVEQLENKVKEQEDKKQTVIDYLERKMSEYDDTLIELVLRGVLNQVKGEKR